jgi:hypothetical protein
VRAPRRTPLINRGRFPSRPFTAPCQVYNLRKNQPKLLMIVDQATRQGYANSKHRLRLVLALRAKRVEAKPRRGEAGCICRVGQENLEWRSRPYVTVSCNEGNELAPPHMATKAKMRRDIWASGRFRGGRSEAIEWPGDFRLLPPPPSLQIWSNDPPPSQGKVVDQDCLFAFGAGSARNRLGIQHTLPSPQVNQIVCVFFFLDLI